MEIRVVDKTFQFFPSCSREDENRAVQAHYRGTFNSSLVAAGSLDAAQRDEAEEVAFNSSLVAARLLTVEKKLNEMVILSILP